jgi:hypothetical protein
METEKVNYNAFLEETAEVSKVNPNLKIGNQKSMFNKEKEPTQNDFESAVSDYKHNHLNIMNKVSELGVKFKNFINDKTLKQNKSQAKINEEKLVIKELSDIAVLLNSDQNQPEGIGSVGISVLLMQLILLQRDKINELEHIIENNLKGS